MELKLQLPTGKKKASIKDPRLLIILSPHKTGKTSAAMRLPNSLLIDLEDSSDYFDGTAINIKQEAIRNNCGMGKMYYAYAKEIQKANAANGKPIYDFIIIDTLTVLQEIARQKALIDYKSSVIGKSKVNKGETINDILKDVAQGAGYDFLYSAFNELFSLYQGLAGKCVIYLAHKKFDRKNRGTKEVEIVDIDLMGQLKGVIPSKVDAIGHLYRSSKKEYTNVLSFKKGDRDNVFGSRPEHLKEKSFIFSVYSPEKEDIVECNWDLVFTSLKNKNTKEMVETNEDYLPEYDDNNPVDSNINTESIEEVNEYPE